MDPATVFVKNNYIYTQSAGGSIVGSKYNLNTLELENGYTGSALDSVNLLYNGTGYLDKADDQIIVEIKKKYGKIIHL